VVSPCSSRTLGKPSVSEYRRIGFADKSDSERVVVEWLLSSVCNYRCSYCPPRLHDGRASFPDLDIAMRFSRLVLDHYAGRQVTFLFTGGEPTLYRNLVELATHVRSRGARVAVLSNGSRPLAWWNDALDHIDQAILSYHYQQADREHFIALTALAAERIPVQVNLVMAPEAFDLCLAVADEIRVRAPTAAIHRKPVLDDWKAIERYDAQALAVLHEANVATVRAERSSPITYLRGNLRRYRADGTSEIVTPTELLLRGENRWSGWTCSIGIDTLFVRWDQLYRGVCGVGGLVGSIYDEELNLPDSPVICNKISCNCIGGMKALKESPR